MQFSDGILVVNDPLPEVVTSTVVGSGEFVGSTVVVEVAIDEQ